MLYRLRVSSYLRSHYKEEYYSNCSNHQKLCTSIVDEQNPSNLDLQIVQQKVAVLEGEEIKRITVQINQNRRGEKIK